MKNITKCLTLIAVIFMSSSSFGQVGLIPGANDPSKADLKVMTENRSLLSTTIRPTEGSAEGFVVGEDEGSIDINDLKLFLEGLREQNKSKLKIQNALDTHYAPTVAIPKLTKVSHKKKKVKKAKLRNSNLQASSKNLL